MHIRPEVNRHVNFWTQDAKADDSKGQPLAAIITHVSGYERVNLAVFSVEGIASNALDVLLLQPGADKPDAGVAYAEWMPFQKGQAAKTEQLEAQLNAGANGDRPQAPLAAEQAPLTAEASNSPANGSGASLDSLKATDAASAAVAVAPRVALADIEAAIALRFDTTAEQAMRGAVLYAATDVEVPAHVEPLKLLSMCVLVMRNGFTIIGKSAPASPENFNAELGRKFAYDDAVRQLWPLMGFALRDRLAAITAQAGIGSSAPTPQPNVA
jgi:hypothetical protein